MERLGPPGYALKEGNLRLREMGVLEWIIRWVDRPLSCGPVPQQDPEDPPFTKPERNAFMRGAPASGKRAGVAVLCKPGMTMGSTAFELDYLNQRE